MDYIKKQYILGGKKVVDLKYYITNFKKSQKRCYRYNNVTLNK